MMSGWSCGNQAARATRHARVPGGVDLARTGGGGPHAHPAATLAPARRRRPSRRAEIGRSSVASGSKSGSG